MADGENVDHHGAVAQERDPTDATNKSRKILTNEGAKKINDEDVLLTREGYKIFREQVVNKGKFAQYYAARTSTGIDCVVKVVPLTSLAIKYKENLQRVGTKILRHLQGNPNDRIVFITDIYLTKIKLYVFCEPMTIDLEKLAKKQALKEDDFKSWIMDILKGLYYLWENCIGHRNIQASNIVLTSDRSVAKITGFGMSMVTWDPEKSAPIFAEKEKEWHHHFSPEAIKGEYDVHCNDIWGVGCIIGLLMSRRNFFEKKTTDHVSSFKTHFRRNEITMSPDLECFLSRIFIADPTQRGNLIELTSHHWFGGDQSHGH
ncbi:striated muscle preferentially expressed protein kinase-like [Panonychus citri]|uniref:striated muscle preferentially expressed protein kinase-like n=1 Tax=Panonychus citri TaxID=50023 RepID=UPI0023078B29|nr:striated muscle preferentially expressed protein kinase-like [Panonychus citri]